MRLDGVWRWVLHVEKHPGYRWRVRLRRAPRQGDVTPEGTLARCPECGGDGFLAYGPQPSSVKAT